MKYRLCQHRLLPKTVFNPEQCPVLDNEIEFHVDFKSRLVKKTAWVAFWSGTQAVAIVRKLRGNKYDITFQQCVLLTNFGVAFTITSTSFHINSSGIFVHTCGILFHVIVLRLWFQHISTNISTWSLYSYAQMYFVCKSFVICRGQ